MDADGGLGGGEMMGTSEVGMDGTERGGDGETGSTNVDSGTSALQSMGYLDRGAETGRERGDSTRSVFSIIVNGIVMVVAAFTAISLLYFLVAGVLAVFGVYL